MSQMLAFPGRRAEEPLSFPRVRGLSSRVGRRVGLGLLGAGLVAAAVVQFAPGPTPRVRALKPPHPVRTAALDGGKMPDEEPLAEEAPPPIAPSELPEEPTRRDLEHGMERAKKYVERCGPVEPAPATVWVKITISRSGNVQSAVVLPPYDQAPVASCIAKAVKHSASFPRFRGELTPTVELTFPFYFGGGAGGVL